MKRGNKDLASLKSNKSNVKGFRYALCQTR
jgi:hypothetical protein